jgi:5-methylcytosine-specific restriction endonuclease McrA
VKNTTAYNADWARKRRDALIEKLGGACARCGQTAEESGYALEFDHPHGRDWEPRKLNRWSRVVRYERDAEAGRLRLLCKQCNSADGAGRRWRRRNGA